MRPTPQILLAAVLLAPLAASCGGGDEPKKVAADAPRSAPAPAARKLVIVIDGRRKETTTTATTVREALTQAGITLGRHDLVKPPADAAPQELIRIRRLLSAPVTRVVRIAPRVVRRKSSKVAPFSEKVLRTGRPGIKIVKLAYVPRRDKKGRARKAVAVIAQQVRRRPVSRIIAVGPSASAGGSVAALNWRGLAACESNNNPKAVNPAGYYGLYQFSLPSWSSVGGSGRPSDASPAEQTYRAQLLYKKVQGRWQGQWPHCGKFLVG